MILTIEQKQILEESNLPLFLLLEAEELNSDDEPDASKDEEDSQDDQQADEEDPQDEQQAAEAQPTEEQLFSYELEGTEDKFLQFTLYDKLIDLSSKITILLDNIKNDASAENMQIISKLEHYSQYLDVLNELIFSISTSVVYKLIGQIELELIDMLEVYNAELEKKLAYDKMKGK